MIQHPNLIRLGLDEYIMKQIQVQDYKNLGRVVAAYKGLYKVALDYNELICSIAGSFEEIVEVKCDYPAVGDWVILNEGLQISKVLNRKNKISRKASGKKVEEQILASNIDCVFIVTSLNQEFNIRRLERYITFLDIQGAEYVLLLTKADLCDDVDYYLNQLRDCNIDIDIIITSSFLRKGLDEISARVQENKTIMFIGSSGVGKSTIINILLDNDIQKTNEVRAYDDKGKHSTTHRELFSLPCGGNIIDTPGMREIQFWSSSNKLHAFEDIELFAYNCKYSNCRHISEPNCAVQDAIERGILDSSRLASYQKLQREAYYASLREDKAGRIKHKKNVKKQSKAERYSIKR